MKKKLTMKPYFLLFIMILGLNSTKEVRATSTSIPNLSMNTKILTSGRAIATWPSGIPSGEKRPVVVFLPGWGGTGAVNAVVSGQNINLVNEGYVTLAIGFDSSSTWISDIDVKTQQGLNKLCIDNTIPANCNAIVLVGSSYGGAQNYWVIEYLRDNGYDGTSVNAKVLGFISEDAGYGAPGIMTDPDTGAYSRTGLADTTSYSVAMIENLGDSTFPVDECTWGNCGARELSNAHLARGDTNVFSICPPGGEHGTRGFVDWNNWVISVTKTIIHTVYNIPQFTGYTSPTLLVGNTCVDLIPLPGLSVSGINIVANSHTIKLRGVNMGDPFWARGGYGATYSNADYAILSQSWHANVVRISIFPTQWKHMDRATLLAGLSNEINAALDNGMYVIISYHVIGWPDGFYQSACCGNAADTYDSDMDVATSFWTQMAQIYGTDTRIIFDLWNEPVHPDDFTLYGSDPNPLWPILKGYYESLIQTVRTNGAQNIILATGNRWGSWLVGIKDNSLSDPNVVYAYHKYSVEGLNTTSDWNKDTGGLIGIKPVIVSEWGYEDTDVINPTWPGSQASYGDPFTQWMENNNLSNLAWMYHHDWTPAFFKVGGSLTNYGAFVKNYIVENTNTWIGSVSITSNKNVVAVGRPHVGAEVASYNGFSAGALTAYIPMLFKDAFGGSYDSAFYIQNVHASNTATLSIKFYDSSGALSCTVNDTLEAQASKGYWVPGQSCLLAGWVGGVVVTSNQPIVAIGRPHIGAEVLTYDGFSAGSTTSYIPMLFKDAFGGSYDSAFYIQNVHASNTATIAIKFYDSAGVLSCTINDTVLPLASKGYWVPGQGCLPTGWTGGVVVTSNQPIVTVGRPHIAEQITTYNGFAAGVTSSYIPMLFKDAFGGSYDAAYYVQNVHATNTANLTIKYYDSAGNLTCTVNDTVLPFASKGYWAPGVSCLPTGWVGGVVITSDQPIVAVGRPHVGAQVTTYNGFTAGSLNSYLPMLFKDAFGGSYDSALYIQNTEATTAAVTTKFYDSAGVLVCTRNDNIPALSTIGIWLPSLTCLQ